MAQSDSNNSVSTSKILQKGSGNNTDIYFMLFFGLLGLLAPPFSIIVAALDGRSTISMINSTVIMLLAILIIVFFVIKSFDLFFARKKELFILNLALLLIVLVSFIFNLVVFLTL